MHLLIGVFFQSLPQRSILCHMFFLIYMNNLTNDIVSIIKQLPDDELLSFFAHSAKT